MKESNQFYQSSSEENKHWGRYGRSHEVMTLRHVEVIIAYFWSGLTESPGKQKKEEKKSRFRPI